MLPVQMMTGFECNETGVREQECQINGKKEEKKKDKEKREYIVK